MLEDRVTACVSKGIEGVLYGQALSLSPPIRPIIVPRRADLSSPRPVLRGADACLSSDTLYRSTSALALRTAWLERALALPAADRAPVLEKALRQLPKTPTAQNVFWRKTLLRLLDSSRLEAGLVSAKDLHRENSPFAALDFGRARITVRPRARA